MDIYPQNMGERNHIEIVRRRAAKGSGSNPDSLVNEPIKPKLGFLGKYWARGTKLTEPQTAIAASASSSITQGYGVLVGILGGLNSLAVGLTVGNQMHSPALGWLAFIVGTASISALGFGPIAQYAFRKVHSAITQNEIEEMITRCQDDLRKAYLGLVRDAILVPLPDPPAENVRQAIEALGEAIDGLPAIISEPIDTTLLRQQATELRDKAALESDTITAESFVRQAESLEQRADTSEHSALVAKRSSALRGEILAKIASLREAIAAQQTGLVDVTTLAELSESARHVAREAQNTASAKDELARYLTPQKNEQAEQPNVQKLGR
jgi:FtsZ-binding cell division protein ZapB